ncbi:disks large homolog 5-like isoform X7 [Aphidius gifuensis]|uniref:disks large homolog 5-like isoform X7 n=1 Tax=Aphidius gifuensis TaxID=684658 RepID=UPI001CDB9D6A|nr:disks large homolog 5-like isoform X7 [Aphidius gifuensis]
MASGASSLDSVDSSDGTSNMERDSGGYGSVGSPVGGSECRSDYDGSQCDQTLELQLLRHQHSDTVRRCDFAPCRCEHTINELEYYRGQHMVAMNQLEATSQETSALRGKYSDLINDKQRLEREVQSLQKEINEFRNQNQEVLVTDTNDAETMTHLYKSAIKKYEVVKEEYDSLRKRYDDLIAGHSSAVNKLELAEEEVTRLKKQYDDIVQERNSAFRERNGLKQQCTAALREWDIALRERNEYREALSKVQQQHEEAVKEINQAMMLRMKASKDMKRLTEERNAALQEYSLIMGERDTVHKEMEKLGDDLQQAYSRITHLENQNKQINDEKKTLSYQTETLRREISSALNDRDEALKECNKLRLKFGDYTECTSRDYKNHIELHSYNHECGDVTNKEAERETNTRDYEKRKKERMDDLDQANLELDKLRKIVDTLQFQLDEAIPDAEVSKRRRDWAFSERDKVVLERESIRSLCDTLRQERDRAVSELAGALRDSDDIKKQKNEALKELKNLREMIKCNNDFNSLRQYQYGYNENDVTEWDLLTIHIDLTRLYQESNDFGFLLVGGRDDPHYPNDTGIYVAQINPGSSLDGKLRINDCILRVNNIDCTSVTTRMILETLRSSNVGTASLTIRRRRCTSKFLRTTQLSIGNISHGITLELGIYISKLSPGSLSAKNGNLAVGDRVLNINGKPMDNVGSLHEAVSILNDNTIDVLTITTLKGIPPLPLLSNNDTTTTTTMTTTTTTTSSSLSSSPIQFNSDNNKQKMVNNYSQTEQERMMLKATSDDYERRYIASNIGDRSIYKVSKSVSSEKSSGISHAWDNIREKIDIVRGRRNSKDREDKKKRNHRNTSPNTFEQEQDAIAELDSVIDSYHKKTNNNNNNNGVLKRSKRRGTATTLSSLSSTTSSSLAAGGATTTTATSGISGGLTTLSITNDNNKIEKNGGTWPKTRGGGPIIQNGTGTIIYPRRTKERPLLSVLPNNPPKYDSFGYNKISNPVPLSSFTNDIAMEKKSVNDFDTSATSATSTTDGRSVGSHTPSETSIDYSIIKSGNIGEYGHTKRRVQKQQQQQYSSGSNELTAQDSLQHNRTHSQLYPSVASSSLSSTTTTTAINQPRQQLAAPGELRRVHIDKSVEPLGIQISCLKSGGVFVSTVSEHSLASQVGLQIGDQLLEVCGINMRSATYQLAANVLRQCGNSITMLVQYSPDKYNETEGSGSSSSSEAGGEEAASRSGSPTPCNSPEVPRKSTIENDESTEPERDTTNTLMPPVIREREVRSSASMEVRGTQEREREIRNSASLDINIRKPELRNSATLESMRNSMTIDSLRSGTLTRGQINQAITTLQRQNATVRSPTQEEQQQNRTKIPPTIEPRYLFIETRKCSNLGISLVGGNGVGIFVHSVQSGCLAEDAGLCTGDRILEYNGVDLRQATAEQAALELARPADKVTLVAQYMPDRYNEVKDKPGDSFYVKAMFDRIGEIGDSLQLRFNKDDILYVDNTMFNGTPGHWRAWVVDQSGRRHQCGIIPSKFKIEEELLLRRSLGDLETDNSRRGTTSARRSFFRRKKHHRSSSRDSKDLSQLTSVNMGWYSDSGTLNEDNLPASYQRVERLDYPTLRPILIVGPLNECVATKLLQEFPGEYIKCLPEAMHCSQATLDQGLRDSLYVDYRKKGSYFECTTVQAVKDICAKNSHCILDISIASIERLHRHQIYPIVLLIKFKSTKQIKEVKDSRYPSDKISAKAAKEMYEHALKLETEYRQFISAVIPAEANMIYLCNSIKTEVDQEQSKALWVPRGPT